MRSLFWGVVVSGLVVFLGLVLPAFGGPDRPVSDGDPGQAMPRVRVGLTGKVVDVQGRPVEGAMIEVKSLDASAPAIPEIAILSDSRGRYRWPLPPGAYEISVLAEGYRCTPRRAVVRSGRETRMDFKLKRIP